MVSPAESCNIVQLRTLKNVVFHMLKRLLYFEKFNQAFGNTLLAKLFNKIATNLHTKLLIEYLGANVTLNWHAFACSAEYSANSSHIMHLQFL